MAISPSRPVFTPVKKHSIFCKQFQLLRVCDKILIFLKDKLYILLRSVTSQLSNFLLLQGQKWNTVPLFGSVPSFKGFHLHLPPPAAEEREQVRNEKFCPLMLQRCSYHSARSIWAIFLLSAVCKYLEREDRLQQLVQEGHILIQTRLAALLETMRSLTTGLALCLPAQLAVRAPPYSLPSTSALGQTGQQLGFHADSTCGNKKRSERLIHCSFSCSIAHQKDAASSILPTYKPHKFSGKNQQKSF